MSYLQIIAAIIGIGTNIPLIVGIFRNKIKQSFAAFFLWGMLDIIAGITTYLQDGNYYLSAGYGISAITVAVCLVIKKQVSWTLVESFTLLLVACCLVIWATSGERAGIIASSLAVVIAGIPQMVDTYKDPSTTPKVLYCFFLFANSLSLVAGKAWTIEERFYAGCVTLLTIIILVFSFRKVITPISAPS